MELKHYRGKVRRFYLSHFKQAYVQQQLERREGRCKMCGACCQLGYRCIYLTDLNTCKIHDRNDWIRPKQCMLFPIDEQDLLEMNNPKCGYFFKIKKLPLSVDKGSL